MFENTENATAAANPEPTTTTEATDAAVEQVTSDDNKNSSASAPVSDAPSEDVVNPNHEEDDNPEENVGYEVDDNSSDSE